MESILVLILGIAALAWGIAILLIPFYVAGISTRVRHMSHRLDEIAERVTSDE